MDKKPDMPSRYWRQIQPPNCRNGLDNNNQEYWDLSPVSTATGKVTVTWDATNNAPIASSENIKVFQVAHKTASGWLNEGASAVSATSLGGSVTSETISSWSFK